MSAFPVLPSSVPARTVPDLLRHAVSAGPDRLALQAPSLLERRETRISYGDLADRAARIATALSERGVGKGDRVGLMFDNRGLAEALVAYHAAHLLGAIAFPINTRSRQGEVEYAVGFARPKALIHDSAYGPAVHRAISKLGGVFCVGTDSAAEAGPAFAELLEAAPQPLPGVELSEHDEADWIFTSGTTGKPKAVAFTHAQTVACGYEAIDVWGLDESSIYHAYSPFYTSTGFHTNPLPCLAARCAYRVEADVDYEKLLVNIAESGSTNVFVLTVMLALMFERLSADDLDRHALSDVRRICYGGQVMPRAFHERVHDMFCTRRGIDLVTLYGLTEAGPSGIRTTAGDHANLLARHGRYGIPIGNVGFNDWVKFRVMAEDGREAQPGESGEIQLRAPSVMARYVEDPRATEAALADGWLRTGDIVTTDADGYVFFVDRSKLMIRRGGFNVSVAEVEGVALGHPAVSEAAAAARHNPVLGEDVHLFVVLKGGGKASPEDIIDFCSENLADYKVPRSVSFLESLPRNAMGRIERPKLKTLVAELFPRAD